MAFGKAFKTRKEASVELKKAKTRNGFFSDDIKIRKMSKKAFPRRKKLFHVGNTIDFLNFE